MQVVKDFDELCRIICPLCADGASLRYRPETQEYVHDVVKMNVVAHSICWATGLRKKYQHEQS